MNKWSQVLSVLLLSTSVVLAENKEPSPSSAEKPQGWSVDIGGTYTWMSFSASPSYSGSTGGFLGKLSYQVPQAFFGQARSYYNLGRLSSSADTAGFHESYTEFVGGYCFCALADWTITPYAGIGFDFLSDHHTAYSIFPSIKLNYTLYYALIGLETHYTWDKWMAGLQVDCLPTFNQYVKIKGLSEAAWTLKNKIGVEVQLPLAYRYIKNYWISLTPYYRFLPIGASNELGLSSRNLNQWGAFLTFRFYL